MKMSNLSNMIQNLIRYGAFILVMLNPVLDILAVQGEEDLFLKSGEFTLAVSQNVKGEIGIEFLNKQGERLFRQPLPLVMLIKTGAGSPFTCEAAYESVKMDNGTLECTGSIETLYGSRFKCTDTYKVHGNPGGFVIDRSVKVVKTDPRDLGFQSVFGVFADTVRSMEDYSFFSPAVWYNQNKKVRQGAIGSVDSHEFSYFRETRLGLPMVMMYDPDRKSHLSIGHYNPEIGSGVDENSSEWLVDASIQYASLGVHRKPYPQLNFIYPASEGEINYVDRKIPWISRSHPVTRDVKHDYSMLVFLGSARDYQSSMRASWRYFYEAFNPDIVECDIEKVFKAGVDILGNVTREYYPGTMGTPFTCYIATGEPKGISHQIGFTGQQGPVGYQLLRYGLLNKDPLYALKGAAVIDFWADSAFLETDFPKMWYISQASGKPYPHFREWPTFMRSATDGMEGILDAWMFIDRYGIPKENWFRACKKFGEWLVRTQNPDGSFYRKINWDGSIDNAEKYNTSNPIRFLINLYWATDDERYLETALKAGEWCYEYIHKPGHYIGGVNNSNSIEKEGGVLALYAFTALYDATGDEKWLQGAMAAADFCETWTYCWDIPVRKSDNPVNIYDKVGTSGQSFISTHASGVDNFMAFVDFYYYRLYLFTGQRHYLDFAKFLQNNTKQTTDWDGKFGYKYPGLVQEAHNVSSFTLRSVETWLPWATIAELDPLSKFAEMFGTMDIDEIEKLPMEKRQEMNRKPFNKNDDE